MIGGAYRKVMWSRCIACFVFWACCALPLRADLVSEAPPPGLLPVPEADIAGVDPSVRSILEDARKSLNALLARGEAGEMLAVPFGELGELYQAHHVYPPSENCYRNAGRLQPDAFRWPYYLGYLYGQTGRPEMAVEAYWKAAAIRPDYLPARLRLGRALLGVNRVDEAETLLSTLLDDPGVADSARFGLAQAALARGDAETTVDLLESVLARHSGLGQVHYTLGMAYRKRGDLDRARQHLVQRGEGEPVIADPELDRMLEHASGVRTLLHRAIAAARGGDDALAAEEFRRALELAPENVNARVSLARVLFLGGRPGESRKEFERAVAQDPSHALGHFLLGVLLQAQGDYNAATAELLAALEIDPEHGGAHHALGVQLQREEAYREAAEHFAQAAESFPENGAARIGEAVCRLKGGESHVQVRRVLEAGLSMAPDDPMLQMLLARLLAASPDDEVRDGQKAVELAGALFERANLLENAETLAMAYAEAGRYQDAAAQQENVLNAALAAGRFELLGPIRKRLEGYREKKPCREPFDGGEPFFWPLPLDVEQVFREYPTNAAY